MSSACGGVQSLYTETTDSKVTDMDIKNKNILITGASRGIGCYIARAIAKHGGNVALLALPSDLLLLQNLEKELTQFHIKVKCFATDLSDHKQMNDVIESIAREFGNIDILISNAAIESVGVFEHQTEQTIINAIAVNLTAPILLAKKLLPKMISQKSGHIVVISSYAGKIGAPFQSVYSATKAGLIKWTLGMKRELKGNDVSVSVISPSYVSQSGMYSDILNESTAKLNTPKIAGEVTPQKVADAVVRSILKDKTDIIVGSPFLRIFTAINELMPNFVTRLFGTLKLSQYNKKLALIHHDAQKRRFEEK